MMHACVRAVSSTVAHLLHSIILECIRKDCLKQAHCVSKQVESRLHFPSSQVLTAGARACVCCRPLPQNFPPTLKISTKLSELGEKPVVWAQIVVSGRLKVHTHAHTGVSMLSQTGSEPASFACLQLKRSMYRAERSTSPQFSHFNHFHTGLPRLRGVQACAQRG